MLERESNFCSLSRETILNKWWNHRIEGGIKLISRLYTITEDIRAMEPTQNNQQHLAKRIELSKYIQF